VWERLHSAKKYRRCCFFNHFFFYCCMLRVGQDRGHSQVEKEKGHAGFQTGKLPPPSAVIALSWWEGGRWTLRLTFERTKNP
jgi:hypothetical protein